jgi:hypothetical protein
VLLDEYSYYTTNTLIGIIICSLISFIGIQILAKKSNKVEVRRERGNEIRHEEQQAEVKTDLNEF